MPGINSVEYPVQGNKCRLVVGKNDFMEALKHNYDLYLLPKYGPYGRQQQQQQQQQQPPQQQPQHYGQQKQPQPYGHNNNSMVDSSLHSNMSVLFISPCMIPMVTFVKEEC